MSTALNELGKICHQNALRKGFYDDIRAVKEMRGIEIDEDLADNLLARLEGTRFGLIMTEAAEAMEGHRNGDRENEGEELADVIIRVVEYAYYRGINLDLEVSSKIHKNHQRPHMHGGKAY